MGVVVKATPTINSGAAPPFFGAIRFVFVSLLLILMDASRRGSVSRPAPGGGGSSNFKVAVRVRPKIEREKKEGAIDVRYVHPLHDV